MTKGPEPEFFMIAMKEFANFECRRSCLFSVDLRSPMKRSGNLRSNEVSIGKSHPPKCAQIGVLGSKTRRILCFFACVEAESFENPGGQEISCSHKVL